ncbi:MAG: DUF2339 domain-containing protein [Limisphaerales bacterium]
MNAIMLVWGCAVLLGIVLALGWLVTAHSIKAANRRLAALEADRTELENRLKALEAGWSAGNPMPGAVEPDVRKAREEGPVPEAGAGATVAAVRRKLLSPVPPRLVSGPVAGREVSAGTEPRPIETSSSPSGGTTEPVREAGARPAVGEGWDWERFMGARLFAWLGGLALFLGVAYFVKYSFDRNLIPPSGRVLIGLMTGLGLLVGGTRLRAAAYKVTAQTLCATGVVILDASLFAGHAFYQLAWLPTSLTFLGMTAVTVAAFVLAVRMDAKVIAILGMLGGFLTPILLSQGRDQALALFLYVALLDLGLVAVALKRRWDSLAVGAAIGTVVMQLGWAGRFFDDGKIWGAVLIFGSFNILFVVALAMAASRRAASDRWGAALILVSMATLGFAGWLLGPGGFGDRPGTVFLFVLVADLCLIGLALIWERMAMAQFAAGLVVFGMLAAWMSSGLSPETLGWGLGWTLVFAALHSAFPLALKRWRPLAPPVPWAGAFPAIGVALLLVPLMKLETPSFAVWPTLMLLNLLAMGCVVWSGGTRGALAAVLLSGLVMSAWIGGIPIGTGEAGGSWIWVVVGSVVLAGMGSGMLAWDRASRDGAKWEAGLVQLPVAAILMPFLLLVQIVARFRMEDPMGMLGAMTFLVAALLALAAWLRLGMLPLVGLVGASLVEYAWWGTQDMALSHPWTAVVWFVVTGAAFAVFPFVVRNRLRGLRLPWVAAALAALPAFHLTYQLVKAVWPVNLMAWVPLAFAIPVGVMLAKEVRRGLGEGDDSGDRLDRLAWLAGVLLFLVTVAIPIQFDRQWLTLGFALEGAALIGLFRRIPHPGLRRVGLGLLVAVFVRLVLNPAIMTYAVRGPWPLWNWWLYTYGLAATAMFVGARWMRVPESSKEVETGRKTLLTLGTILVFVLVNVEIADLFTVPGNTVRWEFTGHFGRDMTYTIAWAVFALALVMIGLWRRVAACRWAGLGLLAVAVLKLFLHDLARLDQLYRVGALIGVALVAIAASVMYQRFVAREDAGRQM